MTRKTDKRCLASFTKPFFPLEEAHFVSPINIPLPPPPQTRTLTSKCYMASVSFTHVHFDHGHAYLTFTIDLAKRLS